MAARTSTRRTAGINDHTSWGAATGGVVRIAYCRDCCEALDRDKTEAEGVLVLDPADRYSGYVCADCR